MQLRLSIKFTIAGILIIGLLVFGFQKISSQNGSNCQKVDLGYLQKRTYDIQKELIKELFIMKQKAEHMLPHPQNMIDLVLECRASRCSTGSCPGGSCSGQPCPANTSTKVNTELQEAATLNTLIQGEAAKVQGLINELKGLKQEISENKSFLVSRDTGNTNLYNCDVAKFYKLTKDCEKEDYFICKK